MMASSTTIRLALSIGRGQGSAPHAVAAALSTSSAADSRLLISSSNDASRLGPQQKRSHHHHAQLNNAQRMNGLNQMMMKLSLYNSYNQTIVSSDRSRLSCGMRWFSSSKTDEEEDQSKSPSATQQQDDDNASTTATSSTTNDVTTTTTSGSSQHNTWVEFQRSIAVTGFETGQTVREQTLGKKSRGGKMDRKRKEREAELEAALRGADTTQVSL
jgi:hypothetical protein